MRNYLIGAALLAMTVTGGAIAQPGKDNAKGSGQGHAAAAGHGNGNPGNGNAGNGNAGKAPGNDRANVTSRGPGNGNANAHANNGNKPDKAVGRKNEAAFRANDRQSPGNPGNGAKRNGGDGDWNDGRNYGDRGRDRDYRGGDAHHIFRHWAERSRNFGLIDGCPPGLAKKRNGCTPPGLDRRDYRRYDRSDWWGLPGLIDGRYRYYGGNLVRLSSAGSILGYYPLLGGALSVGNVWPNWYQAERLPPYYESYYGLGSYNDYRYADNTIYRVDPDTAAITAVVGLLTGDDFAIGQPMPRGYPVYNVPYGYRDRYVDGPDAMYRYNDGYVYRIDPETRLIAAAIELLI